MRDGRILAERVGMAYCLAEDSKLARVKLKRWTVGRRKIASPTQPQVSIFPHAAARSTTGKVGPYTPGVPLLSFGVRSGHPPFLA